MILFLLIDYVVSIFLLYVSSLNLMLITHKSQGNEEELYDVSVGH